MPKIDPYLRAISDNRASDLHLIAGAPPKLRIRGELCAMEGEPILTQELLSEMLLEILTPEQKEVYEKKRDLDFAYTIEGYARFRCNFYVQKRGCGAVFRIIPENIKTIADLNLPSVLERLAFVKKGLILVTGPTGSGKSTTLAAIIDLINQSHSKHILTIEDPIEFVHENKKSLVRQREIGADTKSFSNALRAALREDIDVVLVGEMRDLETIALAITLAETGALVFGTLHTSSAPKTIDRIIDVFPVEQQEQIRVMLADSLRAIIAQQLLPTKDGKGRTAVLEVLFGSAAIANVIREAKTQQILSIIQASGAEGMQTLDSAMMELIKKGTIGAEEAYMRAFDKKAFEPMLVEALMEASSNGQKERIEAMVKEGVSVNTRDVNRATPLILASGAGHMATVQFLLENGAEINAADNAGMTALMRASQKGDLETIKLLIQAGADVSIKNNGGHTALMIAATSGENSATRSLIDARSDVNAKDNLGVSVLIRATLNGQAKVIESLIAAGADIEATDRAERTCLSYAAEKGYEAIVNAVLGAGSDVNHVDRSGYTALMYACKRSVSVVKTLLEAGAAVNLKTAGGVTALKLAKDANQLEIGQLLKNSGATDPMDVSQPGPQAY